MTLRTTPAGYGAVSKGLHWLAVVLLATQFVIGYSLDWEDSGGGHGSGMAVLADGGDERGGSGHGGSGHGGRGHGGSDGRHGGEDDEQDPLVPVHVGLGLSILALALVRVIWRRHDGLPSWAEQLSTGQRQLATWTERALLTLLFVVPLTGIVLITSGDDDVLWLHVGAHVAFFVALAAHVGLVLSKGLLPRMLPSGRSVG
jgi:cytochrome b561